MAKAIEALKEYAQWVGWTQDKVPISPSGSSASSTNPATWGTCDEAKAVRSRMGLPGVGFVLTDDDPFVCIDLDKVIDEDGEVEGWARFICDRFDTFTEYSPSGRGLHIWMRGRIPKAGARKDRVEVYQAKRYLTVTGQLVGGYPDVIEDRSQELLEWFAEVFGAEEAPAAEPVDVDEAWDDLDPVQWIEDALSCLNPDCSYHEWIKVGTALKTGFGDSDGLTYWLRWSEDGVKFCGWEELQRQWRGLQAGTVGLGSLVYMAQPNGFDISYYLPDGHDLTGFDSSTFEKMFSDTTDEVPTGGFELVSFADAYMDRTEMEPDLVGPGILGTGDMLLLFGPPKAMKSMLLLDWCTRLALGDSWLGFETARPLNVMMLQFENKYDQMRSRIQVQELTPDEVERVRPRLWFTKRFVPRLNAEFVNECVEAALANLAEPVDLIVVDPLANLFPGDNENDNAQMMKFLAGLKVLRNRLNPSAAMLLVHHTGKIARKDRQLEPFNAFRGASSLRGSYDTGMFLDVMEDGERKLWFELRNGPSVAPKKLRYDTGRFYEIEDDEGAQGATGHNPGGGLGMIPMLIEVQAASNLYYTTKAFADSFVEEIGVSASSIKNEIKRLAMADEIRFHSGEGMGDGFPVVHHRSSGYLLTPNCQRDPDRKTNPHTGQIVECSGWA